MINVRCEGDGIESVMQCVQSTIPEARFREQSYRQLVWHVAPDALPISVLFQRMEAARAATAMEDYSISQTTLDDVFIRFANLQRETHNELNTNHQGKDFNGWYCRKKIAIEKKKTFKDENDNNDKNSYPQTNAKIQQ